MKGDTPLLASSIFSSQEQLLLCLGQSPRQCSKSESLISGGNLREVCELVLPAGNKEEEWENVAHLLAFRDFAHRVCLAPGVASCCPQVGEFSSMETRHPF